MGKQLFIPRSSNMAKDVTYVAGDIAAGEAALVFPTAGTATLTAFVSSDIALIDLDKPFQALWRKSQTPDIIEVSPNLTLAEMTGATTVAYAAGTAQEINVSNFSDVIPSAQAVGDNYVLKIIKTTPGTANLKKTDIEVTHSGTDYTAATGAELITEMAAAVNALSDTLGMDADVESNTLELTALYTSDHFRVACDGDLAGATIAYTTSPIPGTGSGAQIKLLETKMKSHGEGVTNTIWFPKDYTSKTSDSGEYELGVFDFNLKSPAKHGMNSSNESSYTLYIAAATDEGKCITSDLVDLYTNKIALT